jgi:hypothetical protein
MRMDRLRHLRRPLGLWATFFLAATLCRGSDQKEIDRVIHSWGASQGGIGAEPLVAGFSIQESLEITGQVNLAAKIHVLGTRSGHFRFEITSASIGDLVYGFDGNVAWTAREAVGYGLWPAYRSDPLVWECSLFAGYHIVPASTRHYTKDRESVGGVDCVVAGVAVPGSLDETCYFERKTMRLVRVVRPPPLNSPGSTTLTIDFGDYREVDKLWVPFLLRVDDGHSIATHRRLSVVINAPVDEGSFVLSTAQVEEANGINQILERMVGKMGKPDATSRIHSRVTTVDVQSPTTGLRSTRTISQKDPNLFVLETRTPGMGWQKMGFDGTRGWASSEIEGDRPLKPAELSQLEYSTNVNFFGRLGASCPYRHLIGDRIVNGSQTTAVVLAGSQGPPATFYFEKETGRLIRVAVPNGDDSGTTVDYSDFRLVDDVEVPFSIVNESPVMKTVSKVLSVRNNVSLDDAIFRQREDD